MNSFDRRFLLFEQVIKKFRTDFIELEEEMKFNCFPLHARMIVFMHFLVIVLAMSAMSENEADPLEQ